MRPYLRPVLLGAAMSAAILCLGTIAIGVAAAGARPQAIARAAPTPIPTLTSPPTAPPAATPTPAPTPEQPTAAPAATPERTQLDNYTRVVTLHSAPLEQSLSAVGRHCGNADVSDCRTYLVNFSNESERFTHDLDLNPAPPCLQAADAERRKALRAYEAGAQKGIQGIDTNNLSMIVQSGDTIIKGSNHMKRATALTRGASC